MAADIGVFHLHFGDIFIKKPAQNCLVTVPHRVGTYFNLFVIFPRFFFLFYMLLKVLCLRNEYVTITIQMRRRNILPCSCSFPLFFSTLLYDFLLVLNKDI